MFLQDSKIFLRKTPIVIPNNRGTEIEYFPVMFLDAFTNALPDEICICPTKTMWEGGYPLEGTEGHAILGFKENPGEIHCSLSMLRSYPYMDKYRSSYVPRHLHYLYHMVRSFARIIKDYGLYLSLNQELFLPSLLPVDTSYDTSHSPYRGHGIITRLIMPGFLFIDDNSIILPILRKEDFEISNSLFDYEYILNNTHFLILIDDSGVLNLISESFIKRGIQTLQRHPNAEAFTRRIIHKQSSEVPKDEWKQLLSPFSKDSLASLSFQVMLNSDFKNQMLWKVHEEMGLSTLIPQNSE